MGEKALGDGVTFKIEEVTIKVPGDGKMGDLGKAASADVSNPTKAADVGKRAGKTEDIKKRGGYRRPGYSVSKGQKRSGIFPSSVFFLLLLSC